MPDLPLQSPDFFTTAPYRYEATVDLEASPEQVFDGLADTPRWPEWFSLITTCEWTSPAPYGVGSTRTAHLGPVRIHEEFIVWEPGRAWGFSFVGTSVPMVRRGAELATLTPHGDGTRVHYQMVMEPLPGMALTTRLAKPVVDRALAKGMRDLDAHLARQHA